MKKRIDQHKKDVQLGMKISSAIIARHTEQLEHEMDWANTEYLEKEKLVRKIV